MCGFQRVWGAGMIRFCYNETDKNMHNAVGRVLEREGDRNEIKEEKVLSVLKGNLRTQNEEHM